MRVRTLVVVVAIAANAVFATTYDKLNTPAKDTSICNANQKFIEMAYRGGLPTWDFAVNQDTTKTGNKWGWSISELVWRKIKKFEEKCGGVVDYENFANDSTSMTRMWGEKAWNGKYGVKGKSIHTIKADGRKKWGK